MHGFPAELTSFVGRAQAVEDVVGLLGEHRLVTVTGPGGAGKTRLAGEAARHVAGGFADGVWLAELAAVRNPAQVVGVVAAALGIRELPAASAADALAGALTHRHLLLVLDNCEHVIGAAAELCGRLLLAADDVRVLATSRESLRIAGEVRYRLGPLTLPDPGGPAAAGECEAVTLFADRAWLVDPGFALDAATTAAVGQLVSRLDGLPLAIELAAARVDVLSVAQLLDRIDERFALLADGDRLAEQRQRSLAAAVAWSYELLNEDERRVFRAVSVFPGPFTLEGAEAVAGAGAGPAVLRLVDRSLLLPPRAGPDGRCRYLMLETLRAYGAALLADVGEDGPAGAALAAFAAEVAEEAYVGLFTRTWELAGVRHFDAEDVTLRHALAWAIDRDRATALRLVLAQALWWQLRGRLTSQAPLLAAAAEQAEAGSDQWCAAQMFLASAASQLADSDAALERYTAVRDVLEDPQRHASEAGPVILAVCLGGRAMALVQAGRIAEGAEDSRRALDLARESGLRGLEAMALACLSIIARFNADHDTALGLAHEALDITDEFAGGLQRALSLIVTGVLTDAGDLPAAEKACTAALASCREVGDMANLSGLLRHMTILDLRAGRFDDATVHLREQLQIATQTGMRTILIGSLDCCGHLCAATRRPAEAITVWAAMSAVCGSRRFPEEYLNRDYRDELQREAREVLGPAGTRAAQERGAAMGLAAAEYALMLAAEPGPQTPGGAPRPPADTGGPAPAGLARLSPRERELITLVAKGRTDAQIAAQLYITVRTVSSHLDRIRDKTGCRRRADLTRLALGAGLI
jgi:predicted ATPase/DNA-binding CsgD family transcriptional regulator